MGSLDLSGDGVSLIASQALVALPRDPIAVAALVLCLAWLAGGRRGLRWAASDARRARLSCAAAALVALVASGAWVSEILRGGPRIIDATAYYLEARTIAGGSFTFPLGEPEQSTMGRFLLRDATDGGRAAVLFPPGYPAVLAIGFLLGTPMAVGPALAALLTLATALLAREAATALGVEVVGARRVAVVAAWLSALSGCLRYHTADTMSHGDRKSVV